MLTIENAAPRTPTGRRRGTTPPSCWRRWSARGGVVETVGDAVYAVFARPTRSPPAGRGLPWATGALPGPRWADRGCQPANRLLTGSWYKGGHAGRGRRGAAGAPGWARWSAGAGRHRGGGRGGGDDGGGAWRAGDPGGRPSAPGWTPGWRRPAAERARVSARRRGAGVPPCRADAGAGSGGAAGGDGDLPVHRPGGQHRLLEAHPAAYREAVRPPPRPAPARGRGGATGGWCSRRWGTRSTPPSPAPPTPSRPPWRGSVALRREPGGETGAAAGADGAAPGGGGGAGGPLLRGPPVPLRPADWPPPTGARWCSPRRRRRWCGTPCPPGPALRDLGAHRLKDLARPERVFQLVAPGPAGRLPAAALAGRPAPQPARCQLTSFVGRERELAAVAAPAAPERAAADADRPRRAWARPAWPSRPRPTLVAPASPDGACFVALAPLRRPGAGAPPRSRAALGVREAPAAGRCRRALARPPARPGACCWCWTTSSTCSAPRPLVAALLAACPAPARCWPPAGRRCACRRARVPGAPAGPARPARPPGPRRRPRPGAPAARWRRSRRCACSSSGRGRPGPDFALDGGERAGGGRVCRRLDGLPLALELAAARRAAPARREAPAGPPGAPPPAAHRRGRATLPARQQTLRGAIAWSYDLLAPGEQAPLPAPGRLRRGLHPGGGGGGRAAAGRGGRPPATPGVGRAGRAGRRWSTRACSGREEAPPGGAGGGARGFRLLETVREYALERLEAARRGGGRPAARTPPTTWPWRSGRSRRCGARGRRRGSTAWSAEHDNLRAALARGPLERGRRRGRAAPRRRRCGSSGSSAGTSPRGGAGWRPSSPRRAGAGERPRPRGRAPRRGGAGLPAGRPRLRCTRRSSRAWRCTGLGDPAGCARGAELPGRRGAAGRPGGARPGRGGRGPRPRGPGRRTPSPGRCSTWAASPGPATAPRPGRTSRRAWSASGRSATTGGVPWCSAPRGAPARRGPRRRARRAAPGGPGDPPPARRAARRGRPPA